MCIPPAPLACNGPTYTWPNPFPFVTADEVPDVPLYYVLHDLSKTIKYEPQKMAIFLSAIISAGNRRAGFTYWLVDEGLRGGWGVACGWVLHLSNWGEGLQLPDGGMHTQGRGADGRGYRREKFRGGGEGTGGFAAWASARARLPPSYPPLPLPSAQCLLLPPTEHPLPSSHSLPSLPPSSPLPWVSSSHANPLAVKTDTPCSVIWDILRCCRVKLHAPHLHEQGHT